MPESLRNESQQSHTFATFGKHKDSLRFLRTPPNTRGGTRNMPDTTHRPRIQKEDAYQASKPHMWAIEDKPRTDHAGIDVGSAYARTHKAYTSMSDTDNLAARMPMKKRDVGGQKNCTN